MSFQDFASKLTDWLSAALPIVAAIIGMIAVFAAFRADTKTTAIKQIDADIAVGTAPQIVLMREYHAQGLSQSRVSFWFSLVFASLGFAIIALSVAIFLQRTESDKLGIGWTEAAGKPIFTLIAGTVITAVAALFFVQSNKARQLMSEFFDKLRVDRKLDEALRLMNEIPDSAIQSRIKGIVALTFSDVSVDKDVLGKMLSDVTRVTATQSGENPLPFEKNAPVA